MVIIVVNWRNVCENGASVAATATTAVACCTLLSFWFGVPLLLAAVAKIEMSEKERPKRRFRFVGPHFIYDPFLMMLCLPISMLNPIITAANC